MAEILGHGKVIVELEDNLKRDLAKAKAEFDKAMADMDGKEAKLHIKAEDSEFVRKYRETQAKIKKLEGEKADVKVGADTTQLDRKLAAARGQLTKYGKQNEVLTKKLISLDAERTAKTLDHEKKIAAAQQKRSKGYVAAAKQEETAAKKLAAEIEKAEERKRKATETAEKARRREIAATKRAQEKASEDNRRAQERAAAASKKAGEAERAAQEKLAAARSRSRDRELQQQQRANEAEVAQVSRLQKRYFDLQQQRAKLVKSQGRMFNTGNERQIIGVQIAGVDEQLNDIHRRISKLGEPPIELEFAADDHGSRALSKWANALSETAVRVGPFTTSVAGALRGLTLLGPVLAGVTGGILALGSALGMGLAGGVGVAGAAITGFIPLIGGAAMAMVPFIKEISNANKAQDAYDKAVRENGKNSDQAAKKLKILKNVTKDMSPTTRKAVAEWSSLKEQFKGATQEAGRRNFGKVFSEGIKTASALMPMFGGQVSRFMDTAGDGIKNWMQGLRSVEGQGVLRNMFNRANESLQPFMAGIGNLGAAVGRMFSEFSNYLPGLARGFETWTKGLSEASKGQGMKDTVKTMVSGLRATGQLLRSTGSLLFNFMRVGAGGGGGIQFMNDIAGGIDRINASMMANGGQGLGDFFADSIKTTKELYQAVKPLGQLFMEWVTIMRPFTDLFLGVADAVGSVVQAAAGFGPVRGLMVGAFGLFLAGSLVAKIATVTSALKTLWATMKLVGTGSIALRGLDAVSAGLGTRVKNAVRPVAPPVPIMSGTSTSGRAVTMTNQATQASTKLAAATTAAGTAAATAAPQVAKVGAASVGARAGAAGLAVAAGAAGTVLTAGLAVGAVAAGYGLYKLITRQSEAEKASKQAKQAFSDYGSVLRSMPQLNQQTQASALSLQQATLDVNSAQKEKTRLLKEGKFGTDEYKQAVLNLRAAEQSEVVTRQQVTAAAKVEETAKRALFKTSQKNAEATAKVIKGLGGERISMSGTDRIGSNVEDAFKRIKQGAEESGKSIKEFIKDSKMPDDSKKKLLEYADAMRDGNKAAEMAAVARRRMTLATLNSERAQLGLAAATGKAATQLVNFRQQAGRANAIKIATKFADPKDAGRVAASAAKTIRSGVPKNIATNVALNSKTAEEAVRRLQRIRLTPKTLRIIESGGDRARSILNDLVGKKLAPKVMRILASDRDAQSKYHALVALGIPPKVARYLGDNRDAKRKAAEANAQSLRNLVQRIVRTIQNPPGLFARLGDLVQRVRRVVTGGKADGGLLAFAAGGSASFAQMAGSQAKPNPRQQERAYATATRTGGSGRRTQGEKVTSPRILVGEEATPEYVIATNPRYRKRNRQYLREAGRALGMNVYDPTENVISAYASGWAPPAIPTGGFSAGDSSVKKPSHSPGKVPKKIRRKAKGYGKKKKTAFNTRREWAGYIEGLQTQQGNWEREVSIRESLVEEPTELTREVGRATVDVPDGKGGTKKEDVGPILAPNTEDIDKYKSQLVYVKEAMDGLFSTIARLASAVPQAIAAINVEKAYRDNNIGTLSKSVRNDKTLIKNLSKGKESKEEKERIDRAKARLSKNEDRLSTEKDTVKTLLSDRKTLRDETGPQAGFDLREADIARTKLWAEHEGISGRATGEVGAQNAENAKAGASATENAAGDSGGGDAGPTGLQQQAMTAAELGAINQQYASNGFNFGGGGAGGAGGGMQSNLGGLGALAGATSAATRSITGMTQTISGGVSGTGGVMDALAGGTTAATSLMTTAAGSTGYVSGDTSTASKTVNITNNFQTQPEDPHTWTAGVAFEAGALL